MKRAASRSARLKKVSGQPAAPCGAASNARRSTRPLRIRNSSLILSQLRIFRWLRRPRRHPGPGSSHPGSHPPCAIMRK